MAKYMRDLNPQQRDTVLRFQAAVERQVDLAASLFEAEGAVVTARSAMIAALTEPTPDPRND